MATKSKSAAVVFIKEYLTGMAAGKSMFDFIVCNSRKSASDLAKSYRADPVFEAELSGDLVRVKKVRVVSFTGAYGFDTLKAYAK